MRWRALLAASALAFGCAEGTEPRLPALPAAVVPLDRCLAGARAGEEPPVRLSETGCFERLVPLTPSEELIPYVVASPLFTDGAGKDRWIGLPAGAPITLLDDGSWSFPQGAVLVKLFSLPRQIGAEARPLETRFMIRGSTGWRFYTYRWDDDGRDARLLDGEAHARLPRVDPTASDGETLNYLFPSREACAGCHAGGVIGPSTEQLALEVRYVDADPAPQLDALVAVGALEARPITTEPPMPSPADPSAPLEDRARAYLHANCAHCHRPGGSPSAAIDLDLRWSTPLPESRALCVPTSFPSVAGEGMRIAPGDPDASVIVRRMEAGPDELPSLMPPMGRSIVDEAGVQLVRRWIARLDPAACP